MQSPSEHYLTLPLVSMEEENICLPLVIDVVSKYWGEELPRNDAREIAKKYRNIKGSIMIEGIDLAEKYGFKVYIYQGSLKDIKKRIDQGIPPIVVMPGISETIQHAMVISGYNTEERRIVSYVPEPDTLGAIPESKFEKEWEQDGKLTILVLPSDMEELVKNDQLKFSRSNKLAFQAERSRLLGKIDESIALLLQAIDIDSDNPNPWCMLAGIYNEQNNAQAESCYLKSLDLNSNYYLALRGLGNYYLKKTQYADGEKYYSMAIEINPDRFAPIYKNRAICLLELGNKEKAKTDLRRYIELLPGAADRVSIENAISEL